VKRVIKTKNKTIPLDEIVIPTAFAETRPNPSSLIRKTANFCLERDGLPFIEVDKNNVLFDGYMSYLILKELGFSTARCRVVWVKLTKKEKRQIAKEVVEELKDEFVAQQNANG
jgi:hypothetical protein